MRTPIDDAAANAAEQNAYLRVEGLRVWFPIRRGVLKRRVGWVRAVDGVSLAIREGETLALVGESGSGKTTLGRAIVRITPITDGRVIIDGQDIGKLGGRELRAARRDFQMIFQNPYASLDPMQSVRSTLREALVASRRSVNDSDSLDSAMVELLELVGLSKKALDKFPHEFSGGQRQRVSLARSLAVRPRALICDEPVSALDVSIQAQVLKLLRELQDELQFAQLFISHDLSVVRQIATRIAVMYLGRIVEIGENDDLFSRPSHPYTAALLSAVPVPDVSIERRRERILLPGDPPSPETEQAGCQFRTRCWLWRSLDEPEVCTEQDPSLIVANIDRPGHASACHFGQDVQNSSTKGMG